MRALGSLIFARVVYALNWMNFAAIFYLVSTDVGAGVSELGTLNAAFYLGIGLLQVPAGMLIAKFGPKRVAVTGIFLSSFSALATSVVSTVPALEALRFMVGVGMAFFFAPGIVIVTRLLQGGRSGIGVGLFNSAFDLGGLIAIFGWVVVATATGWRLSLAISGGLGVVTGALILFFLPRDELSSEFRVGLGPLLRMLKDTKMLLFGLGMLSYDIGNTIISGFMVYYLVTVQGVSGTVAALVTSLVTVIPVFTSLMAGRFYDRSPRHRTLMVAGAVVSAGALALAAYPTLYTALACSVLGGVACGIGYTFGFAGARDFNREGKEYEGLAIAWVNSVHLTGSFVPVVFFSLVAGTLGYSQAWLWSALLTLGFLIPMLLLPRTWRTRAA